MSCRENHPDDTSRRLVERMLEDESLTSGLVDDAAAALLDWGKMQVKALVRQAGGLWQEKLDKGFADLRHAMRYISKQVGETTPEMQIERVHTLLEAQAKARAEAEADSEHPLEGILEEEDYAA